MYKDKTIENNTEFSAQYMNENAFYCFEGIMSEEEFDKIIKNLNYLD